MSEKLRVVRSEEESPLQEPAELLEGLLDEPESESQESSEPLSEIEELEQETEEPEQTSNAKFHLLVTKPDAYPVLRSSTDPAEIVRLLKRETRAARNTGDLQLCRAFVFYGELIPIRGDLADNEAFLEIGDQLVSGSHTAELDDFPLLLNGSLRPERTEIEPTPSSENVTASGPVGSDEDDADWY